MNKDNPSNVDLSLGLATTIRSYKDVVSGEESFLYNIAEVAVVLNRILPLLNK